MRIHAFAGTRYSGVDEAGRLAGPPYDQIDDDQRDRLQEIPFHFAHLVRPVSPSQNPHRTAADLYRQWLAKGSISQDSLPALYPYEIELSEGGRRLGVSALVGIEDDSSGLIRPHEATVQKTVEERLSLLRETRVDLEPILMLADDDGSLNRLLEEDLGDLVPLVEHLDADNNRHRLYRLETPSRIAVYQRQLMPCAGLIADGHHRYAVARRFAESRDRPAGATAAKLAVITSLGSPGLRIDPIHRQLRQLLSAEPAAALASSHRRIGARNGVEIANEVAQAQQPALAVSSGPDHIELWGFEPATAPSNLLSHLRHLAVGWLHGALLPAMGLGGDAATDGSVLYRSDPDEILIELRNGRATIGFWLPPMDGKEFARAVVDGRLLPPKSTRFLPKITSGLVWANHDCALL